MRDTNFNLYMIRGGSFKYFPSKYYSPAFRYYYGKRSEIYSSVGFRLVRKKEEVNEG